MLLAAAGLGLLMGLVIGALGGGGGVLTVPLLVYLLGQSVQGATTSSIIIVGVTALVGTLARARGKLIDWRTGIIFGVLGIPAAYLGTTLNHSVDQRVLLLAFAGITILAAAAMLISDRSRGETEFPSHDRSVPHLATALKVIGSGLVVGFMTGFLGVGGGFLVIPVLVIILRMPMTSAVGTSLFIITTNAVSSLLSRLGSPYHLDWKIVIPFTILAVAGSLLGKRVADGYSGDALARAFAVLLILVGGFVAAQSLGAL